MKYTSVDAYNALSNFTLKYPNHLFDAFLTGSAIINKEGEDIDICIKAERKDLNIFLKDGWEPCNEKHYANGEFKALRKEEVNLILVSKQKQYDAWVTATQVMKDLRAIDNYKPSKLARINTFELIKRLVK